MAFDLTIRGSDVVNKLATAAICSVVGAVVMGFYGHYSETKDQTTVLRHVRQSTWAACRLQYELAKKSTAACYTLDRPQSEGGEALAADQEPSLRVPPDHQTR